MVLTLNNSSLTVELVDPRQDAHLLGARLTEQRCFARYEEGHQKWDLINCRPRRAFIAVHGSPHKAAAGYRRTWREGHNASSKFFVGGPLHTLNHREETA